MKNVIIPQERIVKLPKFVQDELNRLSNNIDFIQDKFDKSCASRGANNAYSTNYNDEKGIPYSNVVFPDQGVTLHVNSQGELIVTTTSDDKFEGLTQILPRAANSVVIKNPERQY